MLGREREEWGAACVCVRQNSHLELLLGLQLHVNNTIITRVFAPIRGGAGEGALFHSDTEMRFKGIYSAGSFKLK